MTEGTDDGLNERAQRLLKTLIENYIRDGQPVGSRTLSRDSGLSLSSATIRNVMADLEDLGFVKRGEAGAFIADGHTSPGGSLPLNTNGGGLSYTHTGMYGMFAICEAVRQLRGEAAAQVPDPQISVVLGNGGMFMSF